MLFIQLLILRDWMPIHLTDSIQAKQVKSFRLKQRFGLMITRHTQRIRIHPHHTKYERQPTQPVFNLLDH